MQIITIMSVFDPSENILLHEKQTLASTSCSYPGLFSNHWQTKVILKCQEWGKELRLLQVGVKSIHRAALTAAWLSASSLLFELVEQRHPFKR